MLYFDHRKQTENEEIKMTNNRSLLMNVCMIIGFFFVASIVISVVLGLITSLVWFAFKIALPLGLAIWIVRLISKPAKKARRYY